MDNSCDVNGNKKRVFEDSDDSVRNSDELKRVRVEKDDSVVISPDSNLTRVDSVSDSDESVVETPEANLLRDDILNILDDSDTLMDRGSAIQDLDSVIRSFQEEIQVPDPEPVTMLISSDSGESQPELGYLLEASDDELGLPPTAGVGAGEETKIQAVDFENSSDNAGGFDGMLMFGEEVPSYESFEFGIGTDSNCRENDNDVDFLALGGLFDNSWEGSYETSSVSEVSWRGETLPAL
ncbi:hypothetical protein UlMin_008546 [Ulmus minor]